MIETERSYAQYFDCLNTIKDLIRNTLIKQNKKSKLSMEELGYLNALADINIILNNYNIPNEED